MNFSPKHLDFQRKTPIFLWPVLCSVANRRLSPRCHSSSYSKLLLSFVAPELKLKLLFMINGENLLSFFPRKILVFCFLALSFYPQILFSQELTEIYDVEAIDNDLSADMPASIFTLNLGFGIGSFQNIIVNPGLSIDNTPSDDAGFTTSQKGIPLSLSIVSRLDLWGGSGYLAFSYLRMITFLGRSPGQKSSPGYERFSARSGLDYAIFSSLFDLGGFVELRKDLFKDGSFAHIIDLVYLGARSIHSWSHSRLRFEGAYAVLSRLGLGSGQGFSREKVDRASVRSWFVRLDYGKDFGENSELFFGVEQEFINLSYPSAQAYSEYGFALSDQEPSVRKINLTTDLITCGLARKF